MRRITVDLHTHTKASHADDSVRDMFLAGRANNLRVLGFSEHSPRPPGYDYPWEYRDKITALFPSYVEQVRELQASQAEVEVLLGIEVDWIGQERDFVQSCAKSYEFDYLLGSVHFLDHWGFDADPQDWADLPEAARHAKYEQYFSEFMDMTGSGLFNIAAHPDLIKLFSLDSFTRWISGKAGAELARAAILSIKKAGMSMEVSSAGLRKPCKQIYPGPAIMRMARDLDVPISFASDAHCVAQSCFAFDLLAEYAAGFGFAQSVYFKNGLCREVRF
jgi:histidinol-phosphatase (PHP family)